MERVTVVSSNQLDEPTDMTAAPGQAGILFVSERSGRVVRFDTNTGPTGVDMLDIQTRVDVTQEGGLLAMALHPAFQTNGHVFLSYTAPGSPLQTRLSRFTSLDGGLTIDEQSEVILLALDQPKDFHNGGDLAFGPDGYLYFSLGDGGADPNEASNPSTWFGSILRIDVDTGSPYGIPPGNPFAVAGGAPEVFAFGLRNPWRIGFDPLTGVLWAADVGENDWEEVNAISAGANYGWPTREGAACVQAGCDPTGLVDPFFEYPHEVGCRAIIGGGVYRGSAIPNLVGNYLYTDWCRENLMAVDVDAQGGAQVTDLGPLSAPGRVRGFAEDDAGEFYVLSNDISLLAPSTGGGGGTIPPLLSQTGCVDPADPTQPASGVIPFDVNAPFWSDGGDKDRGLAIPDGTTIDVTPDGDFDLPNGSVLIKNFRLAGRLIETRLLVLHDDGVYAGYTYEWDEFETDALLLPDQAKLVDIDGQDWFYPSQSQCLQCHTDAAGYSLSLEVAQLNRDFTYPSTGLTANQLETFEHIGLLTAPLGQPPSALDAFPEPFDTNAPLDDRARAYLHVNCAQCHRPGTGVQATLDFRSSATLEEMQACNVPAIHGNLGVPGAKLLVPGDPDASVLFLRLSALGGPQMPPIGRLELDNAGIALMDSWITSLPASTCIAAAPAATLPTRLLLVAFLGMLGGIFLHARSRPTPRQP